MATLRRRREAAQGKRQGRNNRKIYQSHRWHEYSRQYRKRNPLCVPCLKEGRTVLAQAVDHIVPIQEGGDIWNEANHQSLCTACHNRKTSNERRSNHSNE